MAELPSQAAHLVLETFLRGYNERHGTAYVLTAEQPDDDASCDYLCTDPARPTAPLKLQFTRPNTIVETKERPDEAYVPWPMHAWLHNAEAREQMSVIRESLATSVARAVTAKATKLGPSATDLVLVVFSNLRRIDELDLREMRGAVCSLGALPFREVWATWEFADLRGKASLLGPPN
jgi:hypothetical protein